MKGKYHVWKRDSAKPNWCKRWCKWHLWWIRAKIPFWLFTKPWQWQSIKAVASNYQAQGLTGGQKTAWWSKRRNEELIWNPSIWKVNCSWLSTERPPQLLSFFSLNITIQKKFIWPTYLAICVRSFPFFHLISWMQSHRRGKDWHHRMCASC